MDALLDDALHRPTRILAGSELEGAVRPVPQSIIHLGTDEVVHLEDLALGLGPATVALTAVTEDRLRHDGPAALVALFASAALVARQLGEGPPAEATYEFAVTHQRELVAACARALAARLAPLA